MIKNYLTIAWRNIWKSKISSVINIIGLSTGMICFIIILLYVKNELSFDSYHKNANRIYRVVKDFVNDDGSVIADATTPPALAPALRGDLPEVETATRFAPSWGRKFLIQYNDKGFYETDLLRVDSNFFKVFDYPFVFGSKDNPFRGPLSIILTQSASIKYFGKEDPIGKTVRINVNNGQDFTVTGVLKDVPQNSHFTFDFLIPFVSRMDSVIDRDWNFYIFYTYALLKPNASAASFSEKLQPLFHKYQPESKSKYYLQLLTDIHLKSNLKWELGSNTDISYINILMAIAIFVIVIASINYVNLATAQSLKRAKEVGVRKVAGASRASLVTQFLTESVFLAFIALVIAILATYILIPFVNKLMNSNLSLHFSDQWRTCIQLAMITFIIGMIAGIYPALQLSSYQPVKVLKGKFITSWRGIYLRKGLVIFQFLISIVLIIGFFTVYKQIDFITQKNLGFDKDNVLMLPNVRGNGRPNTGISGSWLDDIRKMPSVKSVARADGILGGITSTNGVATLDQRNHIALNFMRVDHEFLPALAIELKEGRNFFTESTADSASIILNEKAVEQLGLHSPYLGKQIIWDDESGQKRPVKIVGVAKNFHFNSLHDPIKPFGFISEENNGSNFFIKLHSQHLSTDIASIEKTWKAHNPDKPFEFSFLDEQIGKLYKNDLRFKNFFSYLTILAVLIACLGLLGLSIFTTEARRKEIGIRKVLGATASSLFVLLSKEFLVLVVVAFIAAIPFAWWLMDSWLENFAYRVDIGWSLYLAAGCTAIFIALGTITFHAGRAVRANPVRSLRAE